MLIITMTTFIHGDNDYAAQVVSFLDRIADIASNTSLQSYTSLQNYTSCLLTVDKLVPTIRVKLSASSAPVEASVQTPCNITTDSADRNADFSTNWTAETSPKEFLLAAVHRGSLTFSDHTLYGDRTVFSQVCISFRDVVHPIMGHHISECSKPHFRVCSGRTLRDTARVQHTNVSQTMADYNLFQCVPQTDYIGKQFTGVFHVGDVPTVVILVTATSEKVPGQRGDH
jgi:hypothetical protein